MGKNILSTIYLTKNLFPEYINISHKAAVKDE